ncbi:MAG TPA: 30S ribosomal protein S6 [Beijerinckiaceae bacterium]|jgi:small subunit ribosomal protein S6
MPLYEHVFLARQDVTAQQVETMVDQYKGIIEANGGKVEKTEPWGVKSLAYRIKKNRKAHFTLFNLDAPPAAVAEMERQMRINEDVLRFMTVRVDALEAEPSAMMQKRDRDERKDRERGRRRDDDGPFGGGFGGGDDAAPPAAAAATEEA